MLHQTPHQVLAQVHVVLQVGERHFRLDHPEFGGVPRGVGIFRPERRPEGVHVAQGAGEQFGLQLAGDREVGLLAEEVVGRVGTFGSAGRRRNGQGGDAKHLAGALAVRAGNDGGVQVVKAALAKKLVYGKGRFGADAEQGAVLVGARAEVGDGAQKLVRVTLFLQRVGIRVGAAQQPKGVGMYFPLLVLARRRHQGTLDLDRSAGGDRLQNHGGRRGGIDDDLQIPQARAVVEFQK